MTVWLTAADAAEYVKLSVDLIRKAVKDGDLPAYAIGKRGSEYRLTAADVDAWMLSRSYIPKPATT